MLKQYYRLFRGSYKRAVKVVKVVQAYTVERSNFAMQ